MSMSFIEAIDKMQEALQEAIGCGVAAATAFMITVEPSVFDSLFLGVMPMLSAETLDKPIEVVIQGTVIRRAETWRQTAERLEKSFANYQIGEIVAGRALDDWRRGEATP